MMYLNHKQCGVGLIEVLASMVVLSVGLLSVGTLHVKMIANSNDNKTRNEAMIIAQSRVEELRNYSDGISTRSQFDDKFIILDRGNSTSVSGVNANFTREESIADANSVKSLDVYVSWVDKDNESQEVIVNSAVGWQKPRAAGDFFSSDFEPLIPSTTGRAKLGDGIINLSDVTTIETGDGLFIYNGSDNHSRLSNSEGAIVLTLLDACDLSSGVCSDFVKISGRVYIDKATQNSLIPGSVFVKASDAAYCQQYYYDSNGALKDVTPDTNTAMQTSSNSNYSYYNYTCYLGGGWHGNIGLILDGGIGQKDKICQGDPTTVDAYAAPVIAARRVYRGMTYKHNGSGTAIVDSNGDTIYYSIGTSDALELPATGDSGHDFIISSLNINDTTGDKCITEGVMVRTDSYYDSDGVLTLTPGKLFEGIPTDFFCLNQNASYVDNFDSSVFAIDNSCPFDPSDPPSERHVISGRVLVNTDLLIDSDISSMYVNTSDGSGNCQTAAFTKPSSTQYQIAYTCDVYDWGNGWDGYIQLNTDYSIMSCDYYRQTYNVVTSDFSAGDNICNLGELLTVTGIAVPNSNKKLVSAETTDAGGQCEVSSNGTSYSCNSDLIASGSQWSGRLTFTSSNGSKLCVSDPVLPSGGSYTIVDGSSNVAWIDLVGIEQGNLIVGLQVVANNGDCP